MQESRKKNNLPPPPSKKSDGAGVPTETGSTPPLPGSKLAAQGLQADRVDEHAVLVRSLVPSKLNTMFTDQPWTEHNPPQALDHFLNNSYKLVGLVAVCFLIGVGLALFILMK